MKVAISAGLKPIAELVELRDTLVGRGHECDFLYPPHGLQDFSPKSLRTLLADFDVLYYRSGFGEFGRPLFVSAVREAQKILIQSDTIANKLCYNKAEQSFLVTETGLVSIPKTFFGCSQFVRYGEIAEKFGQRFIIKSATGIQGKEVFLVDNPDMFEVVLGHIKTDYLIQEFITPSVEYRVFTIGTEVYEIIQRTPAANDFRSNLSLGGRATILQNQTLRETLSSLARTIISTLGLEISGIDFIQNTNTGYIYFLEANVNPGWKYLDMVTGRKTAQAIADYFERRLQQN